MHGEIVRISYIFEIVAAYSRSNSSIFVQWVNLEIKIRNDAATP
jgi:hypothetical protein